MTGSACAGGPAAVGGPRALGTSGLEISAIGLGTWAMGGGGWAGGWGPQDDRESIAAIHRAVAAGVTWIDTAPVYGLGHAEEVVGRAMRSLPDGDRPMVFTKCGQLWRASDPYAEPIKCLTPASIRRECEASLRRLAVEAIDLYQMHWPDPETPVEDAWTEMTCLLEEGKVRAIGVSNFDVEQLERCERIRHIDSAQPRYSLLAREAADDVIPWCAENGTGIIVYSPMHSGLLTSRATEDWIAGLPEDDWRRASPDFLPPLLQRNLQLRDALRAIADKHGASVEAVAVAWVLATPGVTGAIVGARSGQQIEGWARGDAVVLDRDDMEAVAAALSETGAGTGPVDVRASE